MAFFPHQRGRSVGYGKGRPHRDMVTVSQNRLLFVACVFSLAFAVIIFRLFDIALVSRKDEVSLAVEEDEKGNTNKKLTQRAEIVDRNGELLAINLRTASLYANPRIIMDLNEAVNKIHKVLPDVSKKELQEKLSAGKSFVWIKRNLTPKEEYAVNSLGIPALAFETEERRIYPQGGIFAHVLGYVGVDGRGLAGIEKQFDKQLYQEGAEVLQLSLDARVQNILYAELQQRRKEFSAKAAAGVVMDVDTGEVIAMVSLPDFDPHNPGTASDEGKFNRATLGVYEMGSVFKTFTMAMGLDANKIGLRSVYEVGKPIRIGRFTIHDTHPKGDFMNVPQIYMYSSNIGTAKIATDVGAEKQQDYLRKLGLLSSLSIELPEKTTPLSPQKWGEIVTMTVGFGHGIAVSPIHVVQATAALVNGGVFHPATLLKVTDGLPEGERVVQKKTSDVIRKLMRLVVEHGTGKKSDVKGYLVGGKTGTAEKSIRGGYNRKAMISSFVGVFPMNKPRYAVIAVLDEPQGTKATGGWATGGMTAAPIVGNVIQRIGPLLGVEPVNSEDDKIRREFYVDYEENDAERQDLASL